MASVSKLQQLIYHNLKNSTLDQKVYKTRLVTYSTDNNVKVQIPLKVSRQKVLLESQINIKDNYSIQFKDFHENGDKNQLFNSFLSINSQAIIIEPDSQPMLLKSHFKFTFMRFFSKMRSNFETGQFSVDPKTGMFIYSSSEILIEDINMDSALLMERIEQNLTLIAKNTLEAFGSAIPRLELQLDKERLINQSDQINIKDAIIYARDVERATQLDINNEGDILMLPEEVKSLVQDYQTLFNTSKQIAIPECNTKVMTQIKVESDREEVDLQINLAQNSGYLFQGGFAKIFRLQIKYQAYGGTKPNPPSRYFVGKMLLRDRATPNISNGLGVQEDSTRDPFIRDDPGEINQEIKILQILSEDDFGCPYIGKYYHCPDHKFKHFLFMEYYYNSSLDGFLLKYNPVLSFPSRIYIITQIAMGLRYLIDRQVTHNDLKPQNIVMGRNLVPRLIDFGEATHPNAYNHNPGRTIPYSAPESMQPTRDGKKDEGYKRQYGRKADLYSFGMVMYEIITGQMPVDFGVIGQKKMEKQYAKRRVRFCVDDKYFISQGPKIVTKSLLKLIKRCLSYGRNDKVAKDYCHGEHLRPHIEQIIVATKCALFYLDKIY